MEPSKKPLNVLIKSIGNNVIIYLKDRKEYYGRMMRADGYMNIMLKGAKEYDNNGLVASYGDVFIRGNNILYISIDPLQPPQPKKSNNIENDDEEV
ncbi:ribonucleoprotein [Candidatus Bathyarchaeota archaeon]|nr:ribonucleoprotein [Candidatus Bathyarchaeota archaeon]